MTQGKVYGKSKLKNVSSLGLDILEQNKTTEF